MSSLFVDVFFFFQAEDGIRDLVRSRGLGDVYKRQPVSRCAKPKRAATAREIVPLPAAAGPSIATVKILSLIHI